MRVATFNACHGSLGGGTPPDTEALAEACRGLDADILALQEVERASRRTGYVDQAAVVARACGMAHAFVPAHPFQGGQFGNALLVRGTIADVVHIPLWGRHRLGGRDRRSALVARARLADGEVTVAVAHLSLEPLDNQPQQDRVVGALVARPGPHLLLGDLNRRTAWVAPGVERVGLVVADDGSPTVPAHAPRYRVDHVAAGGLEIVEVSVVTMPVSDHRALLAEVLPGRAQVVVGRPPHAGSACGG